MKRLVVGIAAAAGAAAALLGVEALAALRRQYLPTSPALAISGSFGPEGGRPLRFVVCGDSTAAGVGAGEPSASYPARLARRLGEAGWRVELIDLGVSGARIADLVREQAPAAAAARPDLVLAALGANDVTHLTPLRSVRRGMDDALDRLLATGAPVVVTGAPDMRARAFLEPLRTVAGWRGRAVSREVQQAAAARGVAFVPLAERTGRFFAEEPEIHFSPDLFHPGPQGYARWAEAIFPEIEAALAGR